MKTYITAHPIDREFQLKLGIYSDGYVKSTDVGLTMHALIEAGHTKINSFVELIGAGEPQLTIHFSKG